MGGEHKEGAMHDTIRGQIQAMIKGQSAIIRGSEDGINLLRRIFVHITIFRYEILVLGLE